ncbi:branched-chain amino acid transport system permease LivM [Klebsiella variicola]|nr:branched-chain amino acid transport system permease LivM [Klebsiella variicola]
MVSRGTVDIATLTMIYIILGLGLNVVVGLSGLLVLGYGGFYAIGAYTFALLNHYYGLGFWTCLPLAGLASAAARLPAGLPGAASARRLSGDCDLRLRRDRAYSAAQQYRDHRRPNGISQIPKPTFFGLEFSRTARRRRLGYLQQLLRRQIPIPPTG